MSTETQEQQKEFDPLVSAFYESHSEQNQEQEKSEEETKAEQEAQLETQRQEEEAEKNKQAEAQKEQERIDQEAKAKAEEEKPKRWDEGLSDQGKFILDKLSKGEDKDVYELLRNKFGYDGLTDEDKAISYLQEKNPHLSKEDLLFKAASEYGIGAEEEDTEDFTKEQKDALRKQEIERKGLISQANKFFDEKKTNVEIPSLPNPLDSDDGYKEYQTWKKQQEEDRTAFELAQEEEKRLIQETEIKVQDTAKQIDTLSIELKIDLDQGEFDLKSEFKLDEKKQKQLAEYVIEYNPTQAEFKAHQNQSGELDMKGYMTMLAHKLFANQIQKAVTKQAITKDRETFIETELKNSTLRNNANMSHQETVEDFYVSAMKQ